MGVGDMKEEGCLRWGSAWKLSGRWLDLYPVLFMQVARFKQGVWYRSVCWQVPGVSAATHATFIRAPTLLGVQLLP